MKKQFLFYFLPLGLLTTLLFLESCGEKCPSCPEDIKLIECIDSFIPYHQNSTVRFSNELGDTLSFTCTERIHKEVTLFPDDSRLQSECCKPYTAEVISCTFENTDGFDFRFNLENDKTYTFVSYIKISDMGTQGVFTAPNSCPFNTGNIILKDVLISGKSFQDVSTSNDFNGNKMLYSYKKPGIVGFIIGGNEWALLE